MTREWLAAAKELTEQMKRYQDVAMLQLFKKQQRAQVGLVLFFLVMFVFLVDLRLRLLASLHQVFEEVSKINAKLNQVHTLLADLSINICA